MLVERCETAEHPDHDLEMAHIKVLVEIQVFLQKLIGCHELSLQAHHFHCHHGLDMRQVKWFGVPECSRHRNRPQVIAFPCVVFETLPGELELLPHFFGIVYIDLIDRLTTCLVFVLLFWTRT